MSRHQLECGGALVPGLTPVCLRWTRGRPASSRERAISQSDGFLGLLCTAAFPVTMLCCHQCHAAFPALCLRGPINIMLVAHTSMVIHKGSCQVRLQRIHDSTPISRAIGGAPYLQVFIGRCCIAIFWLRLRCLWSKGSWLAS
jgi:hypothetical protein